ncbi:hypothetical protein EBQ81_04885 [bacterium]|nr:hypothetical protein [bacterium]
MLQGLFLLQGQTLQQKQQQSLQACLAKDITLNRQLAKRQMAWFKRNPHINWFNDSLAAQQFVLNK